MMPRLGVYSRTAQFSITLFPTIGKFMMTVAGGCAEVPDLQRKRLEPGRAVVA